MSNEPTCYKIPFETKASARQGIKEIAATRHKWGKASKKHPKSGKKQYPYECPFCGLWHLTGIKQKK